MAKAVNVIVFLKAYLLIGYVNGGSYHKDCHAPLGIQNGDIPNSDMTASSEWDANHGPSNARLNRPAGGGKAGAWSARKNDLKQWIQVNFRELTRVTKVVIQGRQDYAQWVTKFKLSYSLDGNHFEHQEKIYQGNNDQNSLVFNILTEPIEARVVRLHPNAWHGHISLRMEFYGCSLKAECVKPLGLENYRIPNSAISASSEWDVNHGPNNARIYHMAGGGRTGAWSAKTNDKAQWIQVNLGKIMQVTKVGMQGRQDFPQWVTKYRVSHSTDGEHFIPQNQEYTGSRDQNTVVISDLIQPIKAQYVRILPKEWHRHISMRMELYGCARDSIDGGFSAWSNWSACTVKCGGGTRKRVRTCTNPPPQYGGKDCQGLKEAIETCHTDDCHV